MTHYNFDDDYEDDFMDDECRLDARCEKEDGHAGRCARFIEHDSMCGCEGCAVDFEAGRIPLRFHCKEL